MFRIKLFQMTHKTPVEALKLLLVSSTMITTTTTTTTAAHTVTAIFLIQIKSGLFLFILFPFLIVHFVVVPLTFHVILFTDLLLLTYSLTVCFSLSCRFSSSLLG